MKKRLISLNIGAKITCGFLFVALIAGAIGVIGIVNLNRVGGSYSIAYADSVTALECMERVSSSFQEMRANLFEVALAGTKEDKTACTEALTNHREIIDESLEKYKSALEKYKAEEVEQELALIATLESAINVFTEEQKNFTNGAAMDTERRNEAYRMLADGGQLHALAQGTGDAIADLVKYNEDYAVNQITANDKLAAIAKIIMIIGILIGILLAVLIGLFIARGISRPIRQIVDASDKLAQGDLNINIEVRSRDETGVLAQAFQSMSDTLKLMLSDAAYLLGELADGNFTAKAKAEESYVGDYSSLLTSMHQLRDTLSDTLKSINVATEQVATGSNQVSSAAQALAAGSTEQAASIEELSASIERIAAQADENSSTILLASKSVRQAGENVNAGNEHMEQLTRAMADIDSSSNQIANITKVIEDIAFQTNILALNAAIEAARAGSAGKGFAVVADEVRSLAAKSAEAARQTGELIQASVITVAKGRLITDQTAQILKDVGVSAGEVTEGFDKIEQATADQTGAIEQIKQALSQISSVVQTNAATAEENSATSEEISAQATTLREEVGKFRLTVDMTRGHVASISLSDSLPLKTFLPETAFDFGKY